jgi:hypothetical protein
MCFINSANKSACVLLVLAGALVLADAVAVGEGGFAIEVEPSIVTAAFADPGLPMYLLKHTGLRWPVLPQWLQTSLSWFLSFFVCLSDPHP